MEGYLPCWSNTLCSISNYENKTKQVCIRKLKCMLLSEKSKSDMTILCNSNKTSPWEGQNKGNSKK